MKKLGIGKKDKGGDFAGEDSKRSHLFGGRSSKSKSPAPSANPYAVPQNNGGQDPYAAKPPQAPSIVSNSSYGGMGSPNYPDSGRASVATQLPAYEKGGYGGIADQSTRSGKSPVPQGGYGGSQAPAPSRYGNQAYGAQSGYGGDRYGQSQPAPDYGSRQAAAGGYGNMDRGPADDGRRNELFGGAKQRQEERQQQPSHLPPDEDPSGYGASSEDPDAYRPYSERQLTAEEQEEEDVQATKDEIKALKREDVSSTRNALRIAAQAEESGRATLERLGAQGERIHNTEKNLDLASSQNRLAEEKAKELKHLNRSMFAPNMQNPFTKQRRLAEKEQAIMDTHRKERERRDATRAAAWESGNRQAEFQRDMRGPAGGPVKKSNLAERSKYQFEADSDDERMEDEIDSNLDALSGAVGRMHKLGKAMGQEVDTQNQHIDRIIGKTDQVDDQIAMNRARLDRIK